MLGKINLIGMIIGLIAVVTSLFFRGTDLFLFIIGIGVIFISLPFVISVIRANKITLEKEEMFLEFSRNLVESVKAGTPISKSIINVKYKHYGVLGENIKKLANQISLGIPLNKALKTFAEDVNNRTISRSLTLIGQAERSGGEIGEILESVTEAVTMSDKLRKERKASISTLVVQGYIIFFVFIIIILVLQFQILPMLSGIVQPGEGGGGLAFLGIGGGEPVDEKEIANSFLYLLLVQGFFSGLTIGKLAEGTFKTGIRHSFALMFSAFLISALANVVFGG
jgi:pilus assembly protein TadC